MIELIFLQGIDVNETKEIGKCIICKFYYFLKKVLDSAKRM